MWDVLFMRSTLRAATTGVLAVALLGLAGPAEAGVTLECFAEVPGMTAHRVKATLHGKEWGTPEDRDQAQALAFRLAAVCSLPRHRARSHTHA